MVVLKGGRQFRVQVGLLTLRPDTPSRRARTHSAAARPDFKEQDRVSFVDKEGYRHVGLITKLNPKTARINCNGIEWRVSYGGLMLAGEAHEESNHQAQVEAGEKETDQRKFRPHDPVRFTSRFGEQRGYIATISGRTAVVVVDDGREFRVPVRFLTLRTDAPSRSVRTRNAAARIEFKEHDRVSFVDKDQHRHVGRIIKFNPKSAQVDCDGVVWRVAYIGLTLEDDASKRFSHKERLDAIEKEANHLLKKHELFEWRFSFDQAARRGGLCSPGNKQIFLSERFALTASNDEVTDTLLHEIAHALVGPKHGHDAVWKEMALRIGCTGRVTHDVNFTSARWIQTCETCGWRIPKMRRRRGLVCSKCRGAVVYQTNDSTALSS